MIRMKPKQTPSKFQILRQVLMRRMALNPNFSSQDKAAIHNLIDRIGKHDIDLFIKMMNISVSAEEYAEAKQELKSDDDNN